MIAVTRSIRPMILALAAVLFASFAAGPTLADTAKSWTLEEQSGQVRLVRPGISPVALTPGDVFAGGDWIETGPDGRAVLRRGEETIVVAPNSRIGLPRENTGPFATRILQTLGTILLKVEKQAKQHFEVKTPYLTAVVKGTTFTVGIRDGRAVVHVVEGLVEVKNLATGRSTLVRPGQTGSVVRGGPADVQVDDAGGAGGAPASDPATQAQNGPSTQAAGAAGRRGNSGNVAIKETLGTRTLDLAKSTNGLIRSTKGSTPRANFGQSASANARPMALTGLGSSNGLALGQGISTNPGLASSNGLAVGQALNANPGLGSGNGNGLALGLGLGADLGNGNGLKIGQGSDPNPGQGHGNER